MGSSSPVRTTCPYCGVGCGVLVGRDDQRPGAWSVQGDPEHPANRGRLCSKGLALGDTMGHEGRVQHPTVGGRRTSWQHALSHTATTLRNTVAAHGPDSVAFYVSGQLLTEDYYVANKLMKGFIGSANIDTNSRLCMASAVAGHKRAFGADIVANAYDDLEQAELLILVGSNLAWCHPVLYRRIEQARASGRMRLVVIDPRATVSARDADLHLAVAPGSDGFLFNGLLAHLASTDALDHAYIEAHTTGFDRALAQARAQCPNLAETARRCDVPTEDLATLFDWFKCTSRTVTLFSQGINQSASGSDKANAIINGHLATGRIGRAGAGAFSITGQPNAMGGREVGGLANMLAAHMGFGDDALGRVGDFWQAERMARGPGLKAVDLFDAVHDGRVRAIWIMATNPIVSLPDGARVREALARCEQVIVSETFAEAATLAYADVVLPAAAWGEKDGTVTNSERCISRQRPLQRAPGEAQPDWWIISEVARRMGYGEAFDYASPWQIFDEHARLTAVENDGTRALDLSGLTGLGREQYEALTPIQWPVRERGKGTARLLGDGKAYFADGKCRFVPIRATLPLDDAPRPSTAFTLNTGRVRDQWHTMTRTGRAPQLNDHIPGPRLALHPCDARRLGIDEGDLAWVRNEGGRVLLEAALDEGQRPGEVFAPIHWNEANAANADVGRLIAPEVDPHSGQPQFKFSRVAIDRAPVECWLRIGSRHGDVSHLGHLLDSTDYWVRRRTAYGYEWLVAHRQPIHPAAVARLGDTGEAHTHVSFVDEGLGLARFTCADLQGVTLVVSQARTRSAPQLLSGSALDQIFAAAAANGAAGMVGGSAGSVETTVCACHGVTRAVLEEAMASGATDLSALGEATAAGTGCGSCRPELTALLQRTERATPPTP